MEQTNLLGATSIGLGAIIGAGIFVLSGTGISLAGTGVLIAFIFTGKLTNGTVFDSNVGGQALRFTVGSGQVISGMDSGVVGMSLGVPKTLVIPYNEAYGAVNPSLVANVPISIFSNTSVMVGERVAGNISGRVVQGTVTADDGNYATVNFNPPLAGQTLIFNLTVVKMVVGSSCFSISTYASC